MGSSNALASLVSASESYKGDQSRLAVSSATPSAICTPSPSPLASAATHLCQHPFDVCLVRLSCRSSSGILVAAIAIPAARSACRRRPRCPASPFLCSSIGSKSRRRRHGAAAAATNSPRIVVDASIAAPRNVGGHARVLVQRGIEPALQRADLPTRCIVRHVVRAIAGRQIGRQLIYACASWRRGDMGPQKDGVSV